MHPNYKLLLAGSICCLMHTAAGAQSVGPSGITAAGRSVTAGGNTHEYAIGQVVSGETRSATGIVVTQGILQPRIQSTGVAGIQKEELQVFPSPMDRELFLQPAFKGGGELSYTLYDASGRLVSRNSVRLQSGAERQSLQVANLAAGQYMLQVGWQQNGKLVSSAYQVQKIK